MNLSESQLKLLQRALKCYKDESGEGYPKDCDIISDMIEDELRTRYGVTHNTDRYSLKEILDIVNSTLNEHIDKEYVYQLITDEAMCRLRDELNQYENRLYNLLGGFKVKFDFSVEDHIITVNTSLYDTNYIKYSMEKLENTYLVLTKLDMSSIKDFFKCYSKIDMWVV